MLTLKELLAITAPKTPPKFWVGADGVRHSFSESVSTDIVGGFKKNANNKGRKYHHGEALYYKA